MPSEEGLCSSITRGQGSYKLYTENDSPIHEDFFKKQLTKELLIKIRRYNRQIISVFSLWYAEWHKIAREMPV